MYKITLDQYPDFEEYKKYLEPPQEQWILKYPDKEWDEDENPGVAFYDAEEKCVYFEAGSHPWESLVASNHLSGSDAVPPTQIRFEEMALQVFKAAEQKRDPATMKMWLPLMPMLYALCSMLSLSKAYCPEQMPSPSLSTPSRASIQIVPGGQ